MIVFMVILGIASAISVVVGSIVGWKCYEHPWGEELALSAIALVLGGISGGVAIATSSTPRTIFAVFALILMIGGATNALSLMGQGTFKDQATAGGERG